MYNDFKKFVKKHQLRGWRLLNVDNQLFLQKYCDKYNLEEYQFFIKIIDGQFNLTHGIRIKSDETFVSVSKKSTYLNTAKNICLLLNEELNKKKKIS